MGNHLGNIGGIVKPVIDLVAALARPEGGEFIGAITQHRHAIALKHFKRLGDIQDRLGTGTDHRHWRAAELLQIGRNIEGFFGTAMHAANTARGKHLDARQRGNLHGGGNSGAGSGALDQQRADIAPACLGMPWVMMVDSSATTG